MSRVGEGGETLQSFLARAFEDDEDEIHVVKKVLLDDSANGAGIREKKWRADLETVIGNEKVWTSLLNARRQSAIESALRTVPRAASDILARAPSQVAIPEKPVRPSPSMELLGAPAVRLDHRSKFASDLILGQKVRSCGQLQSMPASPSKDNLSESQKSSQRESAATTSWQSTLQSERKGDHAHKDVGRSTSNSSLASADTLSSSSSGSRSGLLLEEKSATIPLTQIGTEKEWDDTLKKYSSKDKKELRGHHHQLRLTGKAVAVKDVAKLLKKNIFETISLENVRVEADGLGKALETIKGAGHLKRFQLGPVTEALILKKFDPKLFLNLTTHPTLTELHLPSLKFDLVELWSTLVELITKNTSLIGLDVSRNTLSKDAQMNIALYVRSNPNLLYLTIEDVGFTEEPGLALFKSLLSGGKLRSLRMANNNRLGPTPWAALSAALETTSTLQLLDISGCQLWNQGLSSLTKGLFFNTSLTVLNLAFNDISSVESLLLDSHPNLTHLSLKGNKLRDNLAAEISRALATNRSVQSLDLSENNFTEEGRKAISQLTVRSITLKYVVMAAGHSGDGPDDASREALVRNQKWTQREDYSEKSNVFGNMILLPSLGISTTEVGNTFKRLPKCRTAETLSFADNKLILVPVQLLECEQLTELDLSANQLQQIPPAISQLKRLCILDLRRNKLKELPSEIGKLQKLWKLNVSFNLIYSLPHQILKLSSLKHLNANHNLMSPLSAWIYRLFNSSQLILTGLGLSTFPEEVLAMPNLLHLNLSHNRIRMIPPSIFHNTTLLQLDLSNNQIEALPPQLGLLSRLQILSLAGNPLSSLPDELVRASAKDLCSFLRLYDLGTDMSLHARLMLIGEENEAAEPPFVECLRSEISKIRNIRKPPFLSASSVTFEMSVTLVPLPPLFVTQTTQSTNVFGNTEQNVTFTFWNFLGNNANDTSHALFTSRRSMYFIVFKLNDDFALSKKRIDNWLQSIYGLGASAIFLVGTNLEHARCSKEYMAQINQYIKQLYLNSRFRSIEGFFCVSLKSSLKGFDVLVKAIFDATAKQQWLVEHVPRVMLEVAAEVIKKRQELSPPIMSTQMLSELLGKFKVHENARSMMLQMLYHYGITAEPSLSAKDKGIIIDPFWLYKAYSALTTSQEAMSSGGLVNEANLRSIWAKFPADHHNQLIRTLERMELTMPLRSTPESMSHLVTAVLSEKEPPREQLAKLGWVRTTDVMIGRVFTLDCLPLGLFTRLMVRSFHFAKVMAYWRGGMLLLHESFAGSSGRSVTIALVEGVVHQLRIYMRGPDAAFLLATLVSAINNLLQHIYPEVHTEVKAICTCQSCADSTRLYLYTLEECEGASATSGKLTCKFSSAQVALVDVAPDIALADLEGNAIDLSRVETLQSIGASAYASISKSTYNGKEVAVKQLRTGSNSASFAELRAEAWIMKRLVHPCIIQLVGISRNPMALVMEYAPYGNLAAFVKQSHPLSNRARLRIAVNIAEGLAYMHSLRPAVLHRDIKSHNVLMSSKSDADPVMAKIADFGLCVAAASYMGRQVDNPLWLAPEIMAGEPATDKSDVYSFAMVLWELFSGKEPYSEFEFPFMSKLEAGIIEGLRPTIPADTPAAMQTLMKQTWAISVAQRPTMSAVVTSLKNTPELA